MLLSSMYESSQYEVIVNSSAVS